MESSVQWRTQEDFIATRVKRWLLSEKRTPRHKHKSFDKKKRDSTNLVVFLYYYHILFICLYTMRQPKIAHHNPNVFNKNIHIELTSFVYVFKSTWQMAFRWLDFLTSKKNRNSMTWPFFWSYHTCVTSITAHASGTPRTQIWTSPTQNAYEMLIIAGSQYFYM